MRKVQTQIMSLRMKRTTGGQTYQTTTSIGERRGRGTDYTLYSCQLEGTEDDDEENDPEDKSVTVTVLLSHTL